MPNAMQHSDPLSPHKASHRLIKLASIADWLEVSQTQTYRLIKEEGLPAFKIRPKGPWVALIPDLVDWLKGRKEQYAAWPPAKRKRPRRKT